MSKWYMLFASGEDGAGMSEWSKGEYDSLILDIANQVGWNSWQGEMLVVEAELPESIEPPDMRCWPIDPESEGDDDE